MASIAKTYSESKTNTSSVEGSFYTRLIEKLNFSYFALISMTILIGSCFGGITAMYLMSDNAPIWQLCVNIYITMASNIAAIGQAPTKWVVNLFGLSMLANTVLLLAHVL